MRYCGRRLQREGAGWAEPRVAAFGAVVGGEEAIRWGFQANEHPPVLNTHDRFGDRVDQVEFHPAWHALMRVSVDHGLHNLPWAEPRISSGALIGMAMTERQGGSDVRANTTRLWQWTEATELPDTSGSVRRR